MDGRAHLEGGGRRYFFMHIPKTAGMTLFQRLVECHGEGAVYPLPLDRGRPGAYTDLEYVRRCFESQRDAIRVIAGHFPLCLDEMLGTELTTFTLLRDPVERTLSMLRQHKERDVEFRNASLEDVYSDPVILHGMVHNFTVRVLTMEPAESHRGVMTMLPYDEERLDRAKANLEHRVAAFGLQEHFDEFCTDLSQRFGWDLVGPVAFENRTKPIDVSDELRERIAHDNALDVALFRFGKRLWSRRAPRQARSGTRAAHAAPDHRGP